MKEILDQLKGPFTDILNVGRIIFYPFGGALIVLPLYMILRLLLVMGEPGASPALTTSFFTQMSIDLKHITMASWPVTFALLASSVVVGFLLATVGFPMVLDGLSADVNTEVEREPLAQSSFSYNYPLLRNNKDKEDYAGWLISEYYRFIEIATYIPLGGIIGLMLSEVYVGVFLLGDFARSGSPGLTAAHTMFLILLGALVVIKYYVWPEIWAKRVLIPVLRNYLRAKRNLINGLEAKPPAQHQA